MEKAGKETLQLQHTIGPSISNRLRWQRRENFHPYPKNQSIYHALSNYVFHYGHMTPC